MDAGALNRWIFVQKRVPAKDAAGQPVEAWEDVTARWANIKGQTGLGSITSMQENIAGSVERYSIRVRFCRCIEPNMRVLHDGQIFIVRQVRLDFENRDWTDLVCETGGKA